MGEGPDLNERPRQARVRCVRETFTDIARWRTALAPIFDVAADAGTPLDWCVAHHRLRDIAVCALSGSPATLDRGEGLIDARPLDRILLFACLGGRVAVRCDGRGVVVASGGAVVLDLDRPCSIDAGTFTGVVVMVPRAKVPAILRGVRLHGLHLGAESPAGPLMARGAAALAKAVSGATLDRGEATSSAFMDMAADLLAIATSRGGEPSAGLIAARHLRSRLSHADLSEELVARLGDIVVADLQCLFGGRGGLRDAVAALRVEAAHRYRLVDRTVSERTLARLVGYGSRGEFEADAARLGGIPPMGAASSRRAPRGAHAGHDERGAFP